MPFLLTFWCVARADETRKRAATAASIGLLYVVFPGISLTILSCFQCETYDYEAGSKFGRVMRVDATAKRGAAARVLSCDVSPWESFEPDRHESSDELAWSTDVRKNSRGEMTSEAVSTTRTVKHLSRGTRE